LAITTLFVYFACVPNIWPKATEGFAASGFIKGYSAALMNQGLLIGLPILLIATICALVCCRLDQKVPINYILLFTFTVCESFCVASVCQNTNPKVVLEAASLTTGMVFAITLYAMFTKTDFTIFGPLLFIGLMVFSIAGFFMAIFGFKMGLLWSTIGVIIFSFYLLYDTQLILGGKDRKY
jgi:protein lifeguard